VKFQKLLYTYLYLTSDDNSQQCETSFGSHHRDARQCLPVSSYLTSENAKFEHSFMCTEHYTAICITRAVALRQLTSLRVIVSLKNSAMVGRRQCDGATAISGKH